MTKKELRIKYTNLRQQLTEIEIENKSLAIANQLLKLPIWQKNWYHIFLPIMEKKEINTEYILHILRGKDKNIVLPKADFLTLKMEAVLLTDTTQIKKNNYGIAQPEKGIVIPPEEIEVVFIPLLAYDTIGNRIGYGKGFYDKFLAECLPTTLKIGLSFFPPETIFNTVFTTDIPLDFCVTPTKIFAF